MAALREVQRMMRNAVVSGHVDAAADVLVGGRSPARRLAVHARHYETSLARAVEGRFPATGWLVGPGRLEAAARAYVHVDPPTAPCIGEYGRTFPAFLVTCDGIPPLPYLTDFAGLDWHLGWLALSVDCAPVTRAHLAEVGAEDLIGAVVTLQPGTHYATSAWPIDDLMQFFLGEAPARWQPVQGPVWLEVRGSRGTLQIARVTPATYAFRTAVAAGRSLGDAAQQAWNVDPTFDPGLALAALVETGLVTSIAPPSPRVH